MFRQLKTRHILTENYSENECFFMEAKGEGFEAIFTSNKDLFALKHSIEKNVFSVYIYV